MSPELLYQHLSDTLRTTKKYQIRGREDDGMGGMCAGQVMFVELAKVLDVPVYIKREMPGPVDGSDVIVKWIFNPVLLAHMSPPVMSAIIYLNDVLYFSFSEIAEVIDSGVIHPAMTEADYHEVRRQYDPKIQPTSFMSHYSFAMELLAKYAKTQTVKLGPVPPITPSVEFLPKIGIMTMYTKHWVSTEYHKKVQIAWGEDESVIEKDLVGV